MSALRHLKYYLRYWRSRSNARKEIEPPGCGKRKEKVLEVLKPTLKIADLKTDARFHSNGLTKRN